MARRENSPPPRCTNTNTYVNMSICQKTKNCCELCCLEWDFNPWPSAFWANALSVVILSYSLSTAKLSVVRFCNWDSAIFLSSVHTICQLTFPAAAAVGVVHHWMAQKSEMGQKLRMTVRYWQKSKVVKLRAMDLPAMVHIHGQTNQG